MIDEISSFEFLSLELIYLVCCSKVKRLGGLQRHPVYRSAFFTFREKMNEAIQEPFVWKQHTYSGFNSFFLIKYSIHL